MNQFPVVNEIDDPLKERFLGFGWPKWFDYIRVRKRTIIGSALQPDFIISFGPRNLCTPQKDEKRGEHLVEEIKHWLWRFMDTERAKAERLETALVACQKECAIIAAMVPMSSSGQAAQRCVAIAEKALDYEPR